MKRITILIIIFALFCTFLQAQNTGDSSINNEEYVILYDLHTISKSLFIRINPIKAELILSEYDSGDDSVEDYYNDTVLFETIITDRDTINLIKCLVDTLLSEDIDDKCFNGIFEASIVFFRVKANNDKTLGRIFCNCNDTQPTYHKTQLCALLDNLYEKYYNIWLSENKKHYDDSKY